VTAKRINIPWLLVQVIDFVLAGVLVLLVYPFIALMQMLEEKAGNR